MIFSTVILLAGGYFIYQFIEPPEKMQVLAIEQPYPLAAVKEAESHA
ncbi:hypothetical protein LRR81_14375 [Metabacillus sp. GX 13764]|nr:hypothetical protein [Metabacillus kandeliae]MCD7035428.1 hypothetical protein [Metabacillus kandeliae]